MSIHNSLRKKRGQTANRSVYSRWERILILQNVGSWTEEKKVVGLPKVRTLRTKKKAAKKKVKAE